MRGSRDPRSAYIYFLGDGMVWFILIKPVNNFGWYRAARIKPWELKLWERKGPQSAIRVRYFQGCAWTMNPKASIRLHDQAISDFISIDLCSVQSYKLMKRKSTNKTPNTAQTEEWDINWNTKSQPRKCKPLHWIWKWYGAANQQK